VFCPQRGEVGQLGWVFVEEREHLGQLHIEGADLLDGRLAENAPASRVPGTIAAAGGLAGLPVI
jgi:hypothetical protein